MSVAEALLNLAAAIKANPGKLLLDFPAYLCAPDALARADLAIRFARLPPVTKLRAQVEDWDFTRIRREVY